MTTNGWLQILVYFTALLLLTRPLGGFLYRVFEGQKTLLSPILPELVGALLGGGGADLRRLGGQTVKQPAQFGGRGDSSVHGLFLLLWLPARQRERAGLWRLG